MGTAPAAFGGRMVITSLFPLRTRAGAWVGALLAVVLVSGLLVSCGTSTFTDRTGSLVWHRCGGIECTTLSVPLDWSRPAAGRITLSLARRPADGHRTGVLLTNPGGPGGSGIQLVQ